MLGSELMVILLGLSSAFSWGAGDFSGGYASKRTSAYSVVVMSQFVSLVILSVGVYLINAGPFSLEAAFMGAIAGLCGSAGLVALYTGLARGPMGVVAPVTAVVAAVVPVLFSIFQIGIPGPTDLIGIMIALGAVWMISSGKKEANVHIEDLGLSVFAGLGFGLFFILIAKASAQAVLWPLIFARSSSIIAILLVGLLLRRIERPALDQLPIIALSGIFDTGGNIFYILATRYGRLDIAAVLSSLYPAATVFLAWMILKEKLSRRQWVGVILVFTAVILIAI
ncbi:MAG TPA: DMT family transporter [Anaerolineales bacterium]|nr:DMT family transporter [Anaerolineales bacterium]